ncbi:MAG: hypothetical protein A3F72_15450 [Bacteroidetes bacterium RIFCSPLOWO2_12_FULL_35_15]|nr:MAG: hypothetical protein A3F72_15450 [Bacteroidetes bacterium RIFCSPLOWO2_12_FULL_35_15]
MEHTAIPATKPILFLSHKCGQLEVTWIKDNNVEAIHIEVDRDDGNGFQFLTISSIPNYTDLAALTSKGTWKYRGVYLVRREKIGEWSDVVSISV